MSLLDQDRRPRVALCLFGLLARYNKGKHCYLTGCAQDGNTMNRWLTEHVAHASLLANIIAANPGFEVETFLHTWDTPNADFVRALYRPLRASFGRIPGVQVLTPVPRAANGWPGGSSPPMFASIEQVLRLKRQEEADRGFVYEWVILTRFDVVWLFPVPLSHMEAKLLYVANWCIAVDRRPSTATPAALLAHTSRGSRGAAEDESCHGLKVYEPTIPPDYYFAASSSVIDHFFFNISAELQAFTFFGTREGTANHKVLNGRIKQLGTRVGRALVHNLDLAIVRDSSFNMDQRLPCLLQQGAWGGRSAFNWSRTLTQLQAGGRPPPISAQWAARWRSSTAVAPHDLQELKRPSRASRCPSHAMFCLCEDRDWSQWTLKRQQAKDLLSHKTADRLFGVGR